jgi:hypothetical protein
MMQKGAAILSLMLCVLVWRQSAADETAPGVWQKRQYSFVFMGFTSVYSCDGLAVKLKMLLIAAGARADAKANAKACGGSQVEKLAGADLDFYALVPAGGTTEGERVNGVWRAVALAERSPRDLARGDCELVEQFKAHVLPLLTTRNVDDQTTCIPNQASGTVINLKFETFTAPAPKEIRTSP